MFLRMEYTIYSTTDTRDSWNKPRTYSPVFISLSVSIDCPTFEFEVHLIGEMSHPEISKNNKKYTEAGFLFRGPQKSFIGATWSFGQSADRGDLAQLFMPKTAVFGLFL